MDRETAMASARSHLADCVEFEAISEEEAERLNLYYFSGHCHDYYFFYYREASKPSMVGGSSWVAVSKKTGEVAGRGVAGE